MEKTFQELVSAWNQNDASAFERLWTQSIPELKKACQDLAGRARDLTEADELMSDLYLYFASHPVKELNDAKHFVGVVASKGQFLIKDFFREQKKAEQRFLSFQVTEDGETIETQPVSWPKSAIVDRSETKGLFPKEQRVQIYDRLLLAKEQRSSMIEWQHEFWLEILEVPHKGDALTIQLLQEIVMDLIDFPAEDVWNVEAMDLLVDRYLTCGTKLWEKIRGSYEREKKYQKLLKPRIIQAVEDFAVKMGQEGNCSDDLRHKMMGEISLLLESREFKPETFLCYEVMLQSAAKAAEKKYTLPDLGFSLKSVRILYELTHDRSLLLNENPFMIDLDQVLSEMQRKHPLRVKIIAFHYCLSLSLEEVAQKLQVTIDVVRHQLKKGMKEIKANFKENSK